MSNRAKWLGVVYEAAKRTDASPLTTLRALGIAYTDADELEQSDNLPVLVRWIAENASDGTLSD